MGQSEKFQRLLPGGKQRCTIPSGFTNDDSRIWGPPPDMARWGGEASLGEAEHGGCTRNHHGRQTHGLSLGPVAHQYRERAPCDRETRTRMQPA